MNNLYFFNGFLVQSIDDTRIYNNVFDFKPWPLYSINDDECKAITQYINMKWWMYDEFPHYRIEVVPDFLTIKKYIQLCRQQQYNVRVLAIYSERNQYNAILPKDIPKEFLGYDYVESNCHDSYTYNNISDIEFPNGAYYLKNTNQYGLFINKQILESYISDLSVAIDNGFDTAQSFDMCRMKVYLVNLGNC